MQLTSEKVEGVKDQASPEHPGQPNSPFAQTGSVRTRVGGCLGITHRARVNQVPGGPAGSF